MLVRSKRARGLLIQALLLTAIATVATILILTTAANLKQRGIPVGWDFLSDRSQLLISESPFPHDLDSPLWHGIMVGIGNTLFVSVLVITLSTACGLMVGLARLSGNGLASATCRIWVEITRNFPPIVLLIFLYSLWWKILPSPDEPWALGPFSLTLRGLKTPWFELSPELSAVLIGLTIYTTGFIAEIVRGGVLAIAKGQWEAGQALGMSRALILRLIIIPQTLRVVVPPLNSQYINVVKNSTLVIAIGYPDFLAIMNTVISKTSHSIEGVAIILGVYLTINLALSVLANWYNRRVGIEI